jgi:hypothetical protein
VSETEEGGSVEYLDCNGITAVQNVRPFSLVTFCACSIVSQIGNVNLIEGRECTPITPTPTNTSTNTPTPTSSASILVTPTPTLTPTPTGCDPFSGGSITNTTLDSPTTYSTGYVQFGYVDGGVNQPSGASIKGSGTLPNTFGGLSSGTVCETDGYVFVSADSYGGNPTGVATVITVNLNGSLLGQVQGPFQGSGLPPVTNTFSYTRVVGDSVEVIWDSVTSGATPTPTVTLTPEATPSGTTTPTPTLTVTPTGTPEATPSGTTVPTPTVTLTPEATPSGTTTPTPTLTVTPTGTSCVCTTYNINNTGGTLANYSYTDCGGNSVSSTLEGNNNTNICACSIGPIDPDIVVTNLGTPCTTPTPTPTLTPSPTETPIPVTGYGYNLVVLPYNFPTSGNTIMTEQGIGSSGTTDPNVFISNGNGIYFNSIDTTNTNRTDYFSGFTGQSVTITLTQNGDSAIYSGDTNAFRSWSFTGGTGFSFGYGIGQSGTTGTTVLIQSATTTWVTGQTVYISVEINIPPTPTSTVTPTVTPTTSTPPPTPSITPSQSVFEFLGVGFDPTDPNISCTLSGETVYATKSWSNLIVGNTLYTDSGLTTTVSGGFYSYDNGVTRTFFEVNDIGVIIDGPNSCP